MKDLVYLVKHLPRGRPVPSSRYYERHKTNKELVKERRKEAILNYIHDNPACTNKDLFRMLRETEDGAPSKECIRQYCSEMAALGVIEKRRKQYWEKKFSYYLKRELLVPFTEVTYHPK